MDTIENDSHSPLLFFIVIHSHLVKCSLFKPGLCRLRQEKTETVQNKTDRYPLCLYVSICLHAVELDHTCSVNYLSSTAW